jgi:uncharacterized protein DUF1508
MGFETGQRGNRSPNATGAAPGEERFLSHARGGYASNDQTADAAASPQPVPQRGHGHFDIFREDEVSVSSTQFVGGGWRWRLSDGAGLIVAEAGDYPSELQCRAAVAAIQAYAGFATLR